MKKFLSLALILLIMVSFFGCASKSGGGGDNPPNYSLVGRLSGVQTAAGTTNYYTTARMTARGDGTVIGMVLTFTGQNYISRANTDYCNLIGKVIGIAQANSAFTITIQGLNQGGTTYSTSTTVFTGTVNNGVVTGNIGDPTNPNDLYTRFRADNLSLANTANPLPLSAQITAIGAAGNTGYYTADTYSFNGSPTNCQAFGAYLPFAGVYGFAGSSQSEFNGGLIMGNQPNGYASGVTNHLVAATALFPPPATWTTYGNFAIALPTAATLTFQGTDNEGNTISTTYTKLDSSTNGNGAYESVPDPASDNYYFQAFFRNLGANVLSGKMTDLQGRVWTITQTGGSNYQIQELQQDGEDLVWNAVANAVVTISSVNNIQMIVSITDYDSVFAQRWANGTYQLFRI